MSSLPFATFLANETVIDTVYGPDRRAEIAGLTRLVGLHGVTDFDQPEKLAPAQEMAQVEYVFSTWGMPSLTGDQLQRHFPRLRAVFYGAGSVQAFARPLLERNVVLVSAWRANGVSVAEFTVAQIVLGAKGYFANVRGYSGSRESFGAAHRGRGLYGETIGILGAGVIGLQVIEMLRGYEVKIALWDPFIGAERAAELGVELVPNLEELFAKAYVVSNHVADKPETQGLIHGAHFEGMRAGATFINTGRGRTVVEPDLVKAFTARPDLAALLDVTYPEPAGEDSPLMNLPNVHISTHIAGTINDEVHRMADLCIAEFRRCVAGEPLQHQVTLPMLATMA